MGKKNLTTAAADVTKGMFTNAAETQQNNTETIKDAAEHKKVQEKQDKKYLRLDITGLEDYIYTMARFKGLSATKYIRSLIEADLKENNLIYEKINALKNI